MSIINFCKLANVALDALNIYDSAKFYGEDNCDEEEKSLHASVIFPKGFAIMCQTGETIGRMANVSAKALKITKLLELLSTCCSHAFKGMIVERYSHSDTEKLLKGGIAPWADIFRNIAEFAMYSEKEILEMTPEEKELAKKDPSYDPKKYDNEECQKRLKFAEKTYKISTSVRMLAELTPKSFDLYRELDAFLREHYQVRISNIDTLPYIPEPLHRDVVFRRFICPINHVPIRHPIKDPTDGRIYENNALRTWVRRHENSPLTRRPLTVEQLERCPGVKNLIDRQLELHQQNWVRYLEEGVRENDLNHQPPAPLVQNAIEEDPRGQHE